MADSAPTLLDVARIAGVSTATVSRYFNTPDRVVPATREKVQRVVKELGYTPHFGGRALASNRTNTIGAVIPTMDNSIFARGLQAFQEGLVEAGVTLLVASSNYDPEKELEQLQSLISRGADGLLLIGEARPKETYEFLKRRGIPYVIAWNHREDKDTHYVGFDNKSAARRMAEFVLSKGHRNIAMISGITHYNDRAADRVAGVCEALAAAGLDIEEPEIIEAAYSLEAGGEALSRLLEKTPPPTAVICGNDVLAVGAILKARQLGKRVPEDISITGYDDIELAEVIEPQLTTVHVPHKRMGYAAARLLLELRDGKNARQSIEFETTIVERGSLGQIPPGK
ncbi:MAG: LacI family DNA-binding transcriptional regulator [Pseudomonadota bacterium]